MLTNSLLIRRATLILVVIFCVSKALAINFIAKAYAESSIRSDEVSDTILLESLAKWIVKNKNQKGSEDFERIARTYKHLRSKNGVNAKGSEVRIALTCNNLKSTILAEKGASKFVFDLRLQQVEIFADHDIQPRWTFNNSYGDFTHLIEFRSATIRKFIMLSSRATSPNIIELYLEAELAKLRWVYIMGQQTEELLFHCKYN